MMIDNDFSHFFPSSNPHTNDHTIVCKCSEIYSLHLFQFDDFYHPSVCVCVCVCVCVGGGAINLIYCHNFHEIKDN